MMRACCLTRFIVAVTALGLLVVPALSFVVPSPVLGSWLRQEVATTTGGSCSLKASSLQESLVEATIASLSNPIQHTDHAMTTTNNMVAASSGGGETLSYSAVAGSSLIMITIVGLLYLWEVSVEWVREEIPKTLLPVVESVLGEIGGLGFIGLILSTLLGNHNIKESLESLSNLLFQEEDILVENFEFLHAAFFQVGVGFFLAAGLMVTVGLQKLQEIDTVEELMKMNDEDQGSLPCASITPVKLAHYMSPTCLEATSTKDINLWKEIVMAKEERAVKSLLLREAFLKQNPHLDATSFRVEGIIQASFAQNLYKMVKISPLTWMYLIPALAFANAIDLSHEVVNAASPNAAESVGYFFSTLEAIVPSTFTVVLSAVWGFVNCWKMTQIKYMVLPRLWKDPKTGEAEILPPLADDKFTREAFSSSPAWLQPIESLWGQPDKTTLHQLFGTAGPAGPKLYRNSIKYQTWLCLTHIVFFGTQIVPRDINALITVGSSSSGSSAVGDPSHLTAELVTYGSYVVLSLLQLTLISPRSFWNYCLVSCLDREMSTTLLEMSGNETVPSVTHGEIITTKNGVGANSTALEVS